MDSWKRFCDAGPSHTFSQSFSCAAFEKASIIWWIEGIFVIDFRTVDYIVTDTDIATNITLQF